MLLDMVKSYDEEKMQYIQNVWTQVVDFLAQRYDHKKIVSFLAKVGIIGIEESKQTVYIGVPNEFILTQVKKFFQKPLKEAVQEVYNPQFTVSFVVYDGFSKWSHALLLNLKKHLNIKEKIAPVQENLNNNVKEQLSEYFGILFDPKHTFDTFVVWENNKLAHSVAHAIADAPGQVHNPFFLYGNVWLGKTHLMQAIGNHIIKTFPEKVVLYLPASKLIDEIISAIRKNKLSNLIKKFEDVDVLLVDDIQFLANKETTQEIFHNIFNDFHTQHKQVILTSDRPPKELINIAPRLKSRFGLGVIADISAPNYETRLAIAYSKLDAKDMELDEQILALLVQHVTDNVRELEGAINSLTTRQTLLWSDLTEHDVFSCLKMLGYDVLNQATQHTSSQASKDNTRSVENFANIVEMVANYYNLAVADLKWSSRKKEITTARQILMLIAKKHFNRTLERIGDYFGGKNHASVIYAVNNIERKCKIDESISHDYNVFSEWL